jgi:hypothetical protein
MTQSNGTRRRAHLVAGSSFCGSLDGLSTGMAAVFILCEVAVAREF